LPLGISRLGSSSSDSGGGGGGVAELWGASVGALVASGCVLEVEFETRVAVEASPVFFSMVGGMSVVECLPVVQGGMVRNSSNVRTRGLQHFHPISCIVRILQ